MAIWNVFFFVLYVAVHVTNAQVSNCRDIDTAACQLIKVKNPGLCSQDSLALTACPRFCNLCPLECYHCTNTVMDYHDCNTTMTCQTGEVCMKKELKSYVDGHHEYLMTCARKEICDGDGSGPAFGKRDVVSRDIMLTCCEYDFCNYPEVSTTTTSPRPTTPTTTRDSLTPSPACKRDVIFVVDESDSMRTSQSNVLNFVKDVVSKFEIGQDKTLVALGTFAGSSHAQFDIGDHTTLNSVTQAIDQVNFRGGVGDNIAAMNFVLKHAATAASGDRSVVEDVIILITDDTSHGRFLEQIYENNLHKISDDIITIGIGSHVHTTELQHIATDYGHTFKIQSSSDLAGIMLKVVNLICPALASQSHAGNVIP